MRWLFSAAAAGLNLALAAPCLANDWPPLPQRIVLPARTEAIRNYPQDAKKQEEFQQGFLEGVLDLYRMDGCKDWHTVATPLRDAGHAAGLDWARKNPDLASPKDFGYELRSLTGVYSGGFERSEFVTRSGERLHVANACGRPLPKGAGGPVYGWVSRYSGLGYGHFNQWRQEILLVNAAAEKAAPPAPAPAPE